MISYVWIIYDIINYIIYDIINYIIYITIIYIGTISIDNSLPLYTANNYFDIRSLTEE